MGILSHPQQEDINIAQKESYTIYILVLWVQNIAPKLSEPSTTGIWMSESAEEQRNPSHVA